MHKTTLALALLALAGSASAADTGFYVGFGGGSSDYSSDLGQEIRQAYTHSSAFVVDDARLSDGSGRVWQVAGGYRFLPWLSAELGWTDAGTANGFFALTSTVPLTNGHATVFSRYRLRGLSASLVAQVPLADRLYGYGRLGAVATRLKYDESGTDANNTPHSFRARNENETKPLAGLGLGWSLNERWDLRMEWDRWFDIGTRFDLTVKGNGRFDHVDLYTLNALYRFGG